jgi:hypothetical protein
MRRNQDLARVIVSAVTGRLHPDLASFVDEEEIYDLHRVDAGGGLRLVASYAVDADGNMRWLPAP